MKLRMVGTTCLAAVLLTTGLPTHPQNAPTPTKRQPNIVLMLADDLGWSDVGFNGRREWQTPNLDRFAREGTLFRRWYAACVVCAPSRAALLTGKYGIHNGVSSNNADLPRSEVTIAKALKAQGYTTGLFGKWHAGATRPGETSFVHPYDHGFDEFFGFVDASDAWEHFPKLLWKGRQTRPLSRRIYADTLFAERGIHFMRRHRERPFFLYLPFTTPHFHIEAPEEDVRYFRGRFHERDPRRPYNAIYAAMITRLDREVGRVLKALDDLGLSQDTLVIFTSDHGATFERGNFGASAYHDSNRPFRGQKRTLWEGGIRVPAVMRWPGRVPSGRTSEEVVMMTDLFPTCLAAAGGRPDPAWRVDGINLLDTLFRGQTLSKYVRFWEWRSEGRYQLAAMVGNLKLVITGQGPPELYDVVMDPGERRDLAADYPREERHLYGLLAGWLASETPASKWGSGRR